MRVEPSTAKGESHSTRGPWGVAIARLRVAKGLTRKDVAKLAHMTATTYGRIERGQHTQTSKLQDIADVFGVEISAVLISRSAIDDRARLIQEVKEAVTRDLTASLPATIARSAE